MRAHHPARLALLALASGLWGCGSPAPTGWQTASYLPPSSGLADYQHVTGAKAATPWGHAQPDRAKPDGKPGWGKPDRQPDWGRPDGKPGWGKPDWGRPDGRPDGGGPGKGRPDGKHDWSWGAPWGPPAPYPPFGPPVPFYGPPFPYVPPIAVWGPFSPIPLIDVPGPPVGPVAPLFGGFGLPWGW